MAQRSTFSIFMTSFAQTRLQMPCGAHIATRASPTQTQVTSETHTFPLELRHVHAPYDTHPS
eukprot:15480222-Alexandrium_andersonii.AAC.1